MKYILKLFIFILIAMQLSCATRPKLTVIDTPVLEQSNNILTQNTPSNKVLYLQCGNNYNFSAHIQDNHTAWIFLPEGSKKLIAKKSTSGYLYSNGKYKLQINGDNATLNIDGLAIKQCRNNPEKAAWEEAKLRGADYRAIGGKPAWSLELSLDGNTIFVGDHGATRMLFKTPKPIVDKNNQISTYKMKNGQKKMILKIEGKRCQPSWSNKSYDTTVNVKLGDKTLSGCGNALSKIRPDTKQ